MPLTEYFSPFSDGDVVAMSENEEEEDDDAPLVTRRCAVFLFFLLLNTSFCSDFGLVLL